MRFVPGSLTIRGLRSYTPEMAAIQTPLARSAAILAGWTLLSIFFAPEVCLYFLYKGDAIPWSQAAPLTVANAAIAAAFAPAIVWLPRRFPFGRGTWREASWCTFRPLVGRGPFVLSTMGGRSF